MAGPFDGLTQKLYDGQGVLGQFSNSMWGPSVEDKQLIASREKEGRDLGRQQDQSEVALDIMREVEQVRNTNPTLPSHEIQRRVISSPTIQQKLIRLPADKITSTVQDIIKSTSEPLPEYKAVAPGQTMTQMPTQPGQAPRSVFTAPTTTQQDAEYAAGLTPQKRDAISQGQAALNGPQASQGTAQERALNNMVASKAISPQERDQILSGTQRIEVLKDQLTGRPTGHMIIDKVTGNPVRQFDYKPDGTYNMIDFGSRAPMNPEARAVQGTPVPHPPTPGGLGAPPPGTYPGQDGKPLPPDPQQGRTGMPPLPGQQRQGQEGQRRKIDMVDAVGIVGTGTGVLGGFAGQLDSRLAAEQLNQKRNDLGFFRAHVNALKDNKEFASEVKAREAITPGMWDVGTNPLNAARVFESWYNLAEDKIKTANRVLGDPRFSATAKREAEQSLLWAERTIEMIGPKEELQAKIRELQDNKGGVGVREALDIAKGAAGKVSGAAQGNPYLNQGLDELGKVNIGTLTPEQLGYFKEAFTAAKQKQGRR